MNRDILQVKGLKKYFSQGKGFMSLLNRQSHIIPAVDDISFSLAENQTLGLVGESGCGKTTTGKTLLRLLPATEGKILYRGTEITHMSESAFRPYRKEIQMIFQDLDAALNPKMRIRSILRESIKVHNPGMSSSQTDSRIAELLEQVNIKKNKLSNFPSELSGGEKRRIGLARVLAVNPKLVVADEPTSALDVSIQAQVVNLLIDLQKEFNLSYVFISHDLQLVELLSDQVAVMYMGKIVEIGKAEFIAKRAKHPYTNILWSSLTNKENKEAELLEVASEGCRFAARCPVYKEMGCPDACTDPENAPVLKGSEDHQVACHFPLK